MPIMVSPSEQESSTPADDRISKGPFRDSLCLTIPLPGNGGTFEFTCLVPMNQDEWDYVIDVLTVMAPGIVDGAERACVNPDVY